MSDTSTAGLSVPLELMQAKAFPPLDPSTFSPQLVWLVVAFCLLYLLLSRVALPRIGEVIDERRDRVARDLAEAERLRTETDAALKAYEQAHADARSKAQGIAKTMRDSLAADAEKKRHEVDAALATKLTETEKQIATTKANALAGVNQIAADAAGAIVAKLVGQDASPDEIRKALSQQPGQ
jgi:F-type H+-transporting ATPase subunit b